MYSKNYLPRRDANYLDWLNNFITVANTNLAALGLTAEEIKTLEAERTLFSDALKNSVLIAAQSKSAVEKKSMTKKKSETRIRSLVKKIQSKQDVSNDLKKQLQITVPGQSTPPPVVPFPPIDLVVNINSFGSYELKWARNGNANNTIFCVEALFPNEKEFKIITAITKTNYIHSGNKPGEKIIYRVKAQHGTFFSEPSNEATILG